MLNIEQCKLFFLNGFSKDVLHTYIHFHEKTKNVISGKQNLLTQIWICANIHVTSAIYYL
jgi:hypothetical protein